MSDISLFNFSAFGLPARLSLSICQSLPQCPRSRHSLWLQTPRWNRWDSGSASPSHLRVTMYMPASAIASAGMIASRSFFDTKRVSTGAPLRMTRWNGHIPPCPTPSIPCNTVGPKPSMRRRGDISMSSARPQFPARITGSHLALRQYDCKAWPLDP